MSLFLREVNIHRLDAASQEGFQKERYWFFGKGSMFL